MSPARPRLRELASARRARWQIVERRASTPRARHARESVFAVGNGYLGVRGAPEEGTPAHDAGVRPQRLPRDVADRLPRGRLRPRPHRADDRRRRRRLDHPPVRRRRAARPRHRAAARASSARSTCRPACSAARSSSRPPRGRRMLVRSRRLASLERPPPRRDRLRGRRARRRRARSRSPPSSSPTPRERDAGRPAPRQGLRREGARAGGGARRRTRAPSCSSPPATAGSSSRAGWSTRSTAASRVAVEATPRATAPRSSCSPTSRPASRCGCASTSPTTGRRRAPRRPARRAWTARSTAPRATATTRSSPTTRRHVDDVLAPQRRRGRGRAGRPAGGALQPLPADAGDGARRGPRRAGQGRDRPRLRGPLLLGHRDLRRARSSPTRTRSGRKQVLELPRAACSTPRARRAREVGHARRALPVAHDQRRGGLGLVRGRHRAVPHQRRHRLRDAPVQPRHRRPRRSCSTRAPRCWSRPRASGWSSASSPSAATGASASTA